MRIFGVDMRKIGGLVSALIFVASPATAFAHVESHNINIVPGQTSTCPELTPRVQVYVFDGQLHSFDVSVSDNSYVAIVASVGDAAIPMGYYTRYASISGTTVHVDVQSTPVGDNLPIKMVMLSSQALGTICALTVTAHAEAGDSITTETSHTSMASGEYTSGSADENVSDGTDSVPIKAWGETETGSAPAIGASMQTTLEKICASTSGSTRLWTVLLAVYLLIVTATVLAQPTKPDNQSAALLGAAIVVPLLVLLAIWGFAPSCRIGAWVPIASLIVAAIGCVLGFKNHPQFAKIFTKPPR